MATQQAEKNLMSEINEDITYNNKPKTVRPNIDHLIKRILQERRKEKKKNLIIFLIVLVVVVGSITFSYNN